MSYFTQYRVVIRYIRRCEMKDDRYKKVGKAVDEWDLGYMLEFIHYIHGRVKGHDPLSGLRRVAAAKRTWTWVALRKNAQRCPRAPPR